MKRWLIIGALSGLAFGGWLATRVTGLDLIDGLGIGLGSGLVIAIAFASIPWVQMGQREW